MYSDSPPAEGHAPPRSDMAHPLPCVCLCVDDFGLDGAVNEAVLHLLELGRIGATGALVDGPAWASGEAIMTLPAEACVSIG